MDVLSEVLTKLSPSEPLQFRNRLPTAGGLGAQAVVGRLVIPTSDLTVWDRGREEESNAEKKKKTFDWTLARIGCVPPRSHHYSLYSKLVANWRQSLAYPRTAAFGQVGERSPLLFVSALLLQSAVISPLAPVCH